MDSELTDLARRYYEAIDDKRYDDLRAVLAPEFVQYRGDMTLDGRDEFVSFMREDRPNKETSHVLDGIETTSGTKGDEGETEVVVEGRLLDADGEVMFGFRDRFRVEHGQLAELKTVARPVEN
ncbi:nuclear transport factor 2 family protein [Haloferax namakaokahaiae]|uniref:Nuclear transport factor 2 family protein n=1 Tax=Haloferax namakaokahaiae TaxID=1748331 RepID=A0ABD5ZCZ1_9EURY